MIISPDGRYLVGMNIDRNAQHVWDLWKLCRRLAELKLCLGLATFLALCFAPPVRAQEMKERFTFRGPASGIASLAISADGQTLAIGDKEKTVILRSAVTGKELAPLPCQSAPVISLAFSADGETLATVTKDKTVTLWDVSSGKEKSSFKGVEVKAGLCAINADGKVVLAHIANGSDEKDDWVEIRLLDVASGKHRAIAKRSTPIGVPGISANFALLALAPDGKTIAVGTTDVGGGFRVRLLNTATGKELKSPGDLDRDARLAFSRDGNSLISSSARTIKSWDLASGKARSSVKAVSGIAAVSGDGRTVVTVGPKDAVKIWEGPPPDDLK